jgi:hypothetical protein
VLRTTIQPETSLSAAARQCLGGADPAEIGAAANSTPDTPTATKYRCLTGIEIINEET